MTEISFKKIKSEVALETVARWLGLSLTKQGKDYFAKCPFPDHSEKTGSFTIGGKKPDQFYCFGCGRFGDLFDLCSALMNLNKQESLLWIAERSGYSLQNNGLSQSKSIQAMPPKVSQKKVFIDDPDYYDENLYHEIYSALLEKLDLEGFAESDLLRRGIDLRKFYRIGYRNLPSDKAHRVEIATELAAKFKLGPNRRCPGFFLLENHKWVFGGNRQGDRKIYVSWDHQNYTLQIPGVLFPSYNSRGRIQYLKIRNPEFPYRRLALTKEIVKSWKNSNDPRYELFAENTKFFPPKYQVVSSNERPFGCPAKLDTHYSRLAPFLPQKFILTEGELKADAIAASLDCATAALAGVNLHQDKILSQILGFEIPQLVSDPAMLQTDFVNFSDLCRNSVTARYSAKSFSRLLESIPENSILFAFDRDDSKAVRHSLNKFRLYRRNLGEKFFFNLYYLFWDEKLSKGFDDLLNSGGHFYCIPFNKIWLN